MKPLEIKRLAAFLVAATMYSIDTQGARAQIGTFPPVPEPAVSTVAGSGELGIRDGPAMLARFLQPAAIAVAVNGTLFVADSSAQNIRSIRDGTVRTVAGTAQPGFSSQTRLGRFQDGPAMSAGFSGPSGLAIGRDGALYVADSFNHCIRRLKSGLVSTIAGSITAGSADGAGTGARFNLPKSIASDEAGDLYVADYGNGIRKVTPAGDVTTLPSRPTTRRCSRSQLKATAPT